MQAYSITSRPNELLLGTIHMLKRNLTNKEFEWLQGMYESGAINDIRTMRKAILALDKPRKKDLVASFYINNLLSNPVTWGVNFGNNALWLAFEQGITRPLEAVIGTGIRKLFPSLNYGQTQLTLNEVVPSWAEYHPPWGCALGPAYRGYQARP